MRAEIYDDAAAKSISAVPATLATFNDSVTRLLQEVELDPITVRELMTAKLDVNRELRRLAGAQ